MNHSSSIPENVERCSPAALNARRGNCLLLDVRTPVEFDTVRIEGAILRPFGSGSDDPQEVARLAQGHKEVVLICQSGGRAMKAAKRLQGKLPIPVTVLEGGVGAWEAAGLAVTHGLKRGVSLERQVRIAAGSLVVLGIVLGTWINAGFLGLSGFVGAGLIFAGITDTCGMGLLLARMPWNRGRSACCTINK